MYLLRAADHGHTLAAALVGTGYMTGTYGPGKDLGKAAYWLNEAVEQAAADFPAEPVGEVRGGTPAGLAGERAPGRPREPPGGQAAGQPGGQAAGQQPGGQAAGQPGGQASGQAGGQASGQASGSGDPPSDREVTLDLARFELGLLLVEGDGVPRDLDRGVSLITQAADRGVVQAVYQLGMLRHSGVGVPRDDAKAVDLLRRAAEQGSGTASAAMGAATWTGGPAPKTTRRRCAGSARGPRKAIRTPGSGWGGFTSKVAGS